MQSGANETPEAKDKHPFDVAHGTCFPFLASGGDLFSLFTEGMGIASPTVNPAAV
jgi:hypothetical protein